MRSSDQSFTLLPCLCFIAVIMFVDDLNISPDFYNYFKATYKILKSDPTLYCVSAWNDNGKNGLIENDPGK